MKKISRQTVEKSVSTTKQSSVRRTGRLRRMLAGEVALSWRTQSMHPDHLSLRKNGAFRLASQPGRKAAACAAASYYVR
jgi:hypothetical protein